MPMKFEKWQALGNDYIIVRDEDLPWKLFLDRIKRVCQPHFGVGSDGILLVSPSGDADESVVADVRIFNPDGTEAELSGNGIRQSLLYLRANGHTDLDRFAVRTKAGLIWCNIISDFECEMEMGRASVTSADFPDGHKDGSDTLRVGDRKFEFQHVSIGNPQCAIELPGNFAELTDLDLAEYGPHIMRHHLFPNRTNVSFWQQRGAHHIRARIYERGVGETLSSGTGASGAAVAAIIRGMESPITVELDGGELTVTVSEDLDVKLRGSAFPVFAGQLSSQLRNELESI